MRKIATIMLLIVSIFLICSCGNNSNGRTNNGSLGYSQHIYESRFKNTGQKYFVYDSSNVLLQISGAEFTNGLGDNFYYKKAMGKFAVVCVTVQNNQRDAITVDNSCFRLVDMETRTQYSPSAEGQLAFDMSYDNSSTFIQLNPGLKMSMWVVFDVPESLLNRKIGLLGRGGFAGRDVLMDFGEIKFKRM